MPETDEKHSNQPERLSSTSKWADAIWPEPMQPPKDSKKQFYTSLWLSAIIQSDKAKFLNEGIVRNRKIKRDRSKNEVDLISKRSWSLGSKVNPWIKSLIPYQLY